MSQTDRQASSHWMVRLADSRLFRKLPTANVRVLLEEVEKVPVAAGEVIIKQGDRGDFYYVIEAGSCRVTRQSSPDGPEELVAELGPGNAFGEEEMVAGTSRNASVVMATNGELLRLAKDRFIDLVRDPLIDKVPFRMAARMQSQGSTWLDIRPASQFANGSLPGAINAPLATLREEFDDLDTERSYIVCGDTPEASAVGTLLLAQRGFEAVCLNEPVAEVLAEPGSTTAEEDSNSQTAIGSPLEQVQPAELATNLESNEPISRDLYDDTYVGKSLADLIDQMHTRHRELVRESTGPAAETEETSAPVIDLELFETQVEPSLPRMEQASVEVITPVEPDAQSGPARTADGDELSQLLSEFESRLRIFLERATKSQRQNLQTQLAQRIEKVKEAAVKEVRRQSQAYRDKYRTDHTERERVIRVQYDKLMGLAHKISRQKAELQRARRELEGKLQATTRLQEEIDGLRDTLTESIGHFDELEVASTDL